MLVGFFKSPGDAKCDCRIETFVDRIWLRPDGSAHALRFFVLQVVDSPGNSPLTDVITILIPRKSTSERVQNLNPTCFDRTYYFNTVKTAGYEIVREPHNDRSYADHGIITIDGIPNVLVYVNLEPGVQAIGNCDGIRIRFPSPLTPGTAVKIRLAFEVGALWANMSSPGVTPMYEVRLNYLGEREHEEPIRILGGLVNQIPVLKTLGGEKKAGGFDVFLYYPPGFVTHQPISGTEVADKRNPDGSEGESRGKRFWRLREMIEPEVSEVRTGIGVHPTCQITAHFDQPRELSRVKREVRFATELAIAAILIGWLVAFEPPAHWIIAGSVLILVAVFILGWLLERFGWI